MTPISLPWPVILASASPRRRELLRQLVAEFEVVPADLDEESYICPDPCQTAVSLAEAKALKVFGLRTNALVIGADTVVAMGNRQFGKPSSLENACSMLAALSGHEHVVITGVALEGPRLSERFAASTMVRFRELSSLEIEQYVSTGEPMDKAGAYAIQGGAAGFVAELEGSLSNVVGLPLEDLALALARSFDSVGPAAKAREEPQANPYRRQ